MLQILHYAIVGEQTIHCAACEQRIGNALRRLPGVHNVQASARTQQVQVTIDPAQLSPEQVQTRLEQNGYQVTPEPGAI